MKTLALVCLALVACGDSFSTSADVDGSPGWADVETPDTASDASQEAAALDVDAQPSAVDAGRPTAFDASDEKPELVDAGPFCFICIPGGASGGAGYQLCAPACVVCVGKTICRPGVDP